jgi:hypothetical protein
MSATTCILLACCVYLLGGYFTIQLAASQRLVPHNWRCELAVALGWPVILLAIGIARAFAISGEEDL